MKEHSENSNSIKDIQGGLDGSPFGIITTSADDESNTFVAIGNRRLTPLQPREVSEDMIYNKDWGLITQLIMHLNEHAKEIETINDVIRQGGMMNTGMIIKDGKLQKDIPDDNHEIGTSLKRVVEDTNKKEVTD